jgi:hypothetical protein
MAVRPKTDTIQSKRGVRYSKKEHFIDGVNKFIRVARIKG